MACVTVVRTVDEISHTACSRAVRLESQRARTVQTAICATHARSLSPCHEAGETNIQAARPCRECCPLPRLLSSRLLRRSVYQPCRGHQ